MMETEKTFTMNHVNSSSLLHFTKSLEVLKLILTNGIRFSYAYEPIPSNIIADYEFPFVPNNEIRKSYDGTGVAIPMVSFCDIPLTRASEHKSRYGSYIIGFNKDILSSTYYNFILNPVIYVNSNSLEKSFISLSKLRNSISNEKLKEISEDKDFLKRFEEKGPAAFEEDSTKKQEIDNLFDTKFDLDLFIGFMKPYKDPQDPTYCFFNEREWRCFLPNLTPPCEDETYEYDWKWAISKEFWEKERLDWNNKLAKELLFYINIPKESFHNCLTHIVVETDEEIPILINFIMESPRLLGCTNISKEQKLSLVSKITSMERIALDY